MSSDTGRAELRKSPLLAVVGPTGSGKTATAIRLAQALGGEIVNADAFQVYRGMDVGTAKPTLAEQASCKFHLIDLIDPCQCFSVAEWRRRAEDSIRDIQSRNLVPIICGGAGMYIKALASGWSLAESPPNEALRTELRTIASTRGVAVVHAMLAELDPSSAVRLHPNDLVRVIRAIEVCKLTGTPMSQLHQTDTTGAGKYSILQLGLLWPRSELYSRIDNRVIEMMESGFPAEVQHLLEIGVTRQCPGMRSLGYGEVADMLQGSLSKQEAINAISMRTRQYAKRQITWFKQDRSIRWVEPTDSNWLKDMLTEWDNVRAN